MNIDEKYVPIWKRSKAPATYTTRSVDLGVRPLENCKIFCVVGKNWETERNNNNFLLLCTVPYCIPKLLIYLPSMEILRENQTTSRRNLVDWLYIHSGHVVDVPWTWAAFYQSNPWQRSLEFFHIPCIVQHFWLDDKYLFHRQSSWCHCHERKSHICIHQVLPQSY